MLSDLDWYSFHQVETGLLLKTCQVEREKTEERKINKEVVVEAFFRGSWSVRSWGYFWGMRRWLKQPYHDLWHESQYFKLFSFIPLIFAITDDHDKTFFFLNWKFNRQSSAYCSLNKNKSKNILISLIYFEGWPFLNIKL